MDRILLCPPDFYDIEYEINPWMHINNQVLPEKVMESYVQVRNLYKKLGIQINEIVAERGLPDMVYTANFGQVAGDKFIRANFKYKERRKESYLAAEYFKKNFNFETVSLPEEIFFEGQGDLLNDGKRFFFGWGKRSDQKAIPYLKKFLDAEVFDFELINPYYYHLDTCFAPLTDRLVMINPLSFKPEGLKKIHELFTDVIETSIEDNNVLACNLVHIGNHIVVAKGISQKLRTELIGRGYVLHEIDTAEYIKGGGSIKCISFEF